MEDVYIYIYLYIYIYVYFEMRPTLFFQKHLLNLESNIYILTPLEIGKKRTLEEMEMFYFQQHVFFFS